MKASVTHTHTGTSAGAGVAGHNQYSVLEGGGYLRRRDEGAKTWMGGRWLWGWCKLWYSSVLYTLVRWQSGGIEVRIRPDRGLGGREWENQTGWNEVAVRCGFLATTTLPLDGFRGTHGHGGCCSAGHVWTALLNLLGHLDECLFYVGRALCTRFEERNAQTVRAFLQGVKIIEKK